MRASRTGVLFLFLPLSLAAAAGAANDKDTKGPFKPAWSEVLSFTYSSQPSSEGSGQVQRELSFTGTDILSEDGTSLTVGITGGEEIVEGTISNYGKLTAGGGLGLDFCTPVLTFEGQKGESALNSINASLNVNVPVYSALILELQSGGGFESHQGPVSAILGTSDNIDQVDDRGWSYGAAASFQALDFLSMTLTASQAFSQTFQYENLSRTKVTGLDRTTKTDSLQLQLAFTLGGGPELEVAGELGQEDDPAGSVYSPALGKTVNFSSPTNQTITGYTFTLAYNFE